MKYLQLLKTALLVLLLGFWSFSSFAETLGADVSGITKLLEVKCKNETLGQSIKMKNLAPEPIDCQAAGLEVNAGDEVKISIEAIAQGLIPDAPKNLGAGFYSAGFIQLSWTAVPNAMTYNIYSATQPGVAVDIANLVVAVEGVPPILPWSTVTTYYVVTAVNTHGESLPSAEIGIAGFTPPIGGGGGSNGGGGGSTGGGGGSGGGGTGGGCGGGGCGGGCGGGGGGGGCGGMGMGLL